MDKTTDEIAVDIGKWKRRICRNTTKMIFLSTNPVENLNHLILRDCYTIKRETKMTTCKACSRECIDWLHHIIIDCHKPSLLAIRSWIKYILGNQ